MDFRLQQRLQSASSAESTSSSMNNPPPAEADYLAATKLLTNKIRLQPNNPELYRERSVCQYMLRNYQASLDDINIAIRLVPNEYIYHCQKFQALMGLQKSPNDGTAPTNCWLDGTIERKKALLHDAVISIKKAVELRCAQPESRLSDIFNLLKNALYSVKHARETIGDSQNKEETAPQTHHHHQNNNTNTNNSNNTSTTTTTTTTTTVSTKIDNNHTNNTTTSNNTCIVAAVGTSPTLIPNTATSSSTVSINTNDRQQQPATNLDNNRVRLDHRSHQYLNERRSNNDLVDSTTDRPLSQSSSMSATNPILASVPKASVIMPQMHQTANLHPQIEPQQNTTFTNAPTPVVPNITTSPLILPTPIQQAPSVIQSANNESSSTSYSSKYKRLRRDRERARRGTSKLCTIKPSDLEDLKKLGNPNYMRVIAPIDGWLYSGRLSVDFSLIGPNDPSAITKYIVKLDGDKTGGSYLFNQDTVLNDVIKEVKVKSVSDLRKGARICCYWSRQYKCLSTGVVTSRTFEATKSLVSVKYDNGDLSALPLEDLRLLPPDYPKYMSNCDPLLPARSGGLIHQDNMPINVDVDIEESDDQKNNDNGHSLTINGNISNGTTEAVDEEIRDDTDVEIEQNDHTRGNINESLKHETNNLLDSHQNLLDHTPVHHHIQTQPASDGNQDMEEDQVQDDEIIPPTDETMQLIIDENNSEHPDGPDLMDHIDRISMPSLGRRSADRGGANYINNGVEYQPWVFVGKPRKSKRGRTSFYTSIKRGQEEIKVGDTAELMPRDQSILPFIAKIDSLWETPKGEMKVKVRWYYRLIETEGDPLELKDGDSALFETHHSDINDVQSIHRSTKILSWTDYCRINMGRNNDGRSNVFYLAGYYDAVCHIKHLRSDVREANSPNNLDHIAKYLRPKASTSYSV